MVRTVKPLSDAQIKAAIPKANGKAATFLISKEVAKWQKAQSF